MQQRLQNEYQVQLKSMDFSTQENQPVGAWSPIPLKAEKAPYMYSSWSLIFTGTISKITADPHYPLPFLAKNVLHSVILYLPFLCWSNTYSFPKMYANFSSIIVVKATDSLRPVFLLFRLIKGFKVGTDL